MGKHGPNRLENYQAVHEKAIRGHLDRGFLLSDGLEWSAQGDGVITLIGRLDCIDNLYISVTKEVRILEGDGLTALVQRGAYSYNAVLGGVGTIFRYDSPHQSHNQFHHVHRYDVFDRGHDAARDSEGVGILEDLSAENQQPVLHEVIEELADWYYAHYENIPRLRNRS